MLSAQAVDALEEDVVGPLGVRRWQPRELVHARLHGGVHGHGPAPLPLRLPRPLVRGIHPHLVAQAADGRGEVQVVDGGVFHHHGVARWVHAGGDGPDHFLPAADVHIVVHHHDELGVHELAQMAPHTHHHAPRVAGVGFLDLHHIPVIIGQTELRVNGIDP